MMASKIFCDLEKTENTSSSALTQQQQQTLNSKTEAVAVQESSTSCSISPISIFLSGTKKSSSSSLSASGAVINCNSKCSSVFNLPTTKVEISTGRCTSASSTSTASAVASVTSSVTSTSFSVASTISTTTLPSVNCSPLSFSKIDPSCATTSRLILNDLRPCDEILASHSFSLAEDPRAFQLALELSMINLNDSIHTQVQQYQQQHQLQKLQKLEHQHLQQMQNQQSQEQQSSSDAFNMSTINSVVAAAAAAANTFATPMASSQLNQLSTSLFHNIEDRSKKSQNMTECVPVPSSEHVAEIVGRQGCKIKALRAKTNTYIKTPVRGEEPVFVVTGRKEDVAKAKREILSAADHFSVIRATRKSSPSSSLTGCPNDACGKTLSGLYPFSDHVTIKVRVPYRVVGLVVGSKGATIKHIQQDTQTYIVTPSREREPIFDVTGLPHQVQAARKQIEAHIALRTGATDINDVSFTGGNNSGTLHTINSLSQILNDDVSPEFLTSIYKNGLCSTFECTESSTTNAISAINDVSVGTNENGINISLKTSNVSTQSIANNTLKTHNSFAENNVNSDIFVDMTAVEDGLNTHHTVHRTVNPNIISNGGLLNGPAVITTNFKGNAGVSVFNRLSSNSNGMSRSCSSASSTTSSKSTNNGCGSNCSRPELSNIWKNLGDSLDVDEGIGESPSIWTLPCVFNTPLAQYSASTNSISPTDSLLRESNTIGQLLAIQTQTQQQKLHQLQYRSVYSETNNSNSSTASNQHQLILEQNQHILVRRECFVCSDKEVTAALAPCGHNMFCMECANRICASSESNCPMCSQNVLRVIRIPIN